MNVPPLFAGSDRSLAPRATRGRTPAGRAAFTLVEVLLSLGIVSFAFMALCGVLPVGLQSYRDAIDNTCRANIVRVISAELAQAPYDTIEARKGEQRFFSDQGLEVTSEKDAHFRVTYQNILTSTSLFGPTNSSLKPVTIDISSVQGGKPLARVTLFVADNGT